jgi:transcriptional regulator with XRE-family HTH domain
MARKKTPLGRTFGRVLKAARENLELTQETLAAQTDYSQVQIAYLETGISTPSLQGLILLEQALGVASGELLRRTVEELPKRWRS